MDLATPAERGDILCHHDPLRYYVPSIREEGKSVAEARTGSSTVATFGVALATGQCDAG